MDSGWKIVYVFIFALTNGSGSEFACSFSFWLPSEGLLR